VTRIAEDGPRLIARLSARVSRDEVLSNLRDAATAADAELCLVGGFVRDAALGNPTGDVDLVAGRGCGRLIRQIRDRWGTDGFRFRRRRITTWRFRLGQRMVDLVDAAHRGIEADLLRRDLTINSVAFELNRRELIDPTGGLADLRLGRLRAPRDDAFAGDPLRALRVCRFLSSLPDFVLTPVARRAALSVAPAVRRTPVERVLPELDKLLLGRDPLRGLDTLRTLGLRGSVLPELEALERCAAGRERPDVWTHTLATLRLAAGPRRLPGLVRLVDPDDRLVLRWALLLHDISKPETLARAADGRPTFHGHEVRGRLRAGALMRRLRVPASRRRRVERLVLNHLRPGHLADSGVTARGLRRLADEMREDLPLLVAHAACDARASGGPDGPLRWRRMRGVLVALLELHDRRPDAGATRLIDGRDVMRVTGLEPGPRVGRLLQRIRRKQQSGEIETRRQALEFLRSAFGGEAR
jgi:tRNA nucleotidyltransferase/poly(A) polymerase